MILPKCEHAQGPDRQGAPPVGKWIFSCEPCVEAAIRANIMDYQDSAMILKLTTRLHAEIKTLRRQLEDAMSDIHDYQMSRLTTFLRCQCGRLREKGLFCRGCGQ